MQALVDALFRGKQTRNEQSILFTIGIRPDEVNFAVFRRNSLPQLSCLCLRKQVFRVNTDADDVVFRGDHGPREIRGVRDGSDEAVRP